MPNLANPADVAALLAIAALGGYIGGLLAAITIWLCTRPTGQHRAGGAA